MDDSNIIQFPKKNKKTNQSKPQLELVHDASRSARGSRFETEQAKVVLSASLASLVFIFTLLNNSVFNSHKSQSINSVRSIASVDSTARGIASVSNDYAIEREAKLAKRLADWGVTREMASIGQKPSAEDRFKSEVLQHRYSAVFDSTSRHVKEVSLPKDFEAQGIEPLFFGDLVSFLKDNKAFMPTYDAIDIHPEHKTREPMYILKREGQGVAQVHFDLDQYGRVLGFKVSSH